MKFRPLHDRIVVKRVDAEEKTKGESSSPTPPRKSRRKAKSSPSARRPGRERQAHSARREGRGPHPVRQVAGTDIKLEGEELLIMKESDVMGVVEGPAASAKKAA